MLIFSHGKTDVLRKPGRGVLFCLKSESIFQISMDGNDFFILLEVNDIFKAVKCGLLAVLVKWKGNVFSFPLGSVICYCWCTQSFT